MSVVVPIKKTEKPDSSVSKITSKSELPTTTNNKQANRVDIDGLVVEFQKRLGKKWDAYQMAVSLFLVGKLSRSEFLERLDETLDSTTIRYHNQLLLANLANCLRSEPSDGMSGTRFGTKSQGKKRKVNRSSQYEILKRDILSLPIRERKRLKNITRESGKKGMTNSTMALTRQKLLPKIPIKTPGGNVPQTKEIISETVAQASKWAQEVATGIKAPLCSESFELPDKESLQTRMLGIAREHGLSGSINPKAAELLSVGLECHLKSFIETALARVKQRSHGHKRQRVILTAEDFYDTLQQVPHMADDCGPKYYLSDVLLKNDDDESVLELQSQRKDAANKVSDRKYSPVSFLLKERKIEPKVGKEQHKEKVVAEQTTKEDKLKPDDESSHKPANDSKPDAATTPISPGPNPGLAFKNLAIGGPNDLNWMINDLLAE